MLFISFFMLMGMSISAHAASPGDIVTVAGGGVGDNGPAISASLYSPWGVTVDSSGNLYIADYANNRIRMVAAGSGIISTVAGTGIGSSGIGDFFGDGGVATSASLYSPRGVTVDSAGNLFIADQSNHRIRMVAANSGIITTVAGNGTAAFSGDNGPAVSASLYDPMGVTVDSAGNLFIADRSNNRIRKVASVSGVITTVAGNGTAGFSGDNGVATSASINNPYGVTIDSGGNLYIADQSFRLRKVAAESGIISTVAGNGIATFVGDGGAATSASLTYLRGVTVDSAGNLYIADAGNYRIRKVAADNGIITTVAGNGTPTVGDNNSATSASLNNPDAVTVDSAGNLFIADTSNHRIRKVAVDSGIITTVAGNGIAAYAGDGGAATEASLNFPKAVVIDNAGNLYIADQSNHRIRKVDTGSGIITTVAGYAGAAFTGDGGAATAANLNTPRGVTVDNSGNLYIADTSNSRIRKVAVGSGIITTVAGNGIAAFAGDGGSATAASLKYPIGVALDNVGNLYIADRSNHRIRKVAADSGIITTVAGNGTGGFAGDGGMATAATLSSPNGVTVDSFGNLYIADDVDNRIRKVSANTGIIATVAGDGTIGLLGGSFGGDGGVATSGSLNNPHGVSVDSIGNLYIADFFNNRIRKVFKPDAISVAISYSPAGPYMAGDLIAITATFNNPVANAPAPQIALSGANTLAATDMTKVDNSQYTYSHNVGAGSGTVTVSLPTGIDINGVPLSSIPRSGANFTVIAQPTLSVSVGGNGKGDINSIPSGITCSEGTSGTCTFPFFPGTVTLHATPSTISQFVGWDGCTASTSTSCEVLIDGNKSVSATFSLAPKAMIGTSGYDSLNAAYLAAYNSADASATINLLDTELTENLDVIGKEITLKGGFSADFKTRSGPSTILRGMLTIKGGSLKVDGITIGFSDF
ncbi:MAG: hypothetical protein RW306_07200 [Geobacteraceae bacterium]|nr:hypothetical protein [Geobacteraceae bacterium]